MKRFIGLGLAALALSSTPRTFGAHGVGTTAEWFGTCDASAAVALDAHRFLLASDEDSKLRLYDLREPGRPQRVFDLAPGLELDSKSPETDLEAAVRVGDRAYWIGSHGRNVNGKERASRQRFFATRLDRTASGFDVRLEGRPYKDLLLDLETDPRLLRFRLAAAAQLAPKDKGGLAIEGLCDTPEGHLLIGFRNPIREGRALVVPLLNPDRVIAGERARLGDPVTLDLGGLSVRDFVRDGTRYFIIAGPFGSGGKFRFYEWDGPGSQPEVLDWKAPKKWSPEALVLFPEAWPERIFVVSDDGTREVDGCDCKFLPDPAKRRFRAGWIKTGLP